MIENLDGIHETVSYKPDTQICLYYNNEDTNYPPHWHTPFEIIMPILNTYRVKCGNQVYNLKEGDIIIICPGIVHELFAPPTGERIIFQPYLSMQNALKELEPLTTIISPAILITEEFFPQIHEKIHNYLLEIKEDYFSSPPYSEAAIYARTIEILILVGRHYRENMQQFHVKSNKQKEYLDKFLFICNYINEHCTEDLTLEKVASLAGFSKYHFTRLFKQYADTSFYKYLNQKRISYAKNLLLDPDLSVTEAAIRSGFSSLTAFIRMFKLINQCTPTEFRNMYDD